MKQNNFPWIIIAALIFTIWLAYTGRIQIPLPQPTIAAIEPVYALATAVPIQIEQPAVIIQAPATFTPAAPLAVDLVAPGNPVRVIQPALVTAVPAQIVPTPAIAHSLADLYIIHGPDVVTPCLFAIQNNRQLTAVCDSIRTDLIRIAGEGQGE